MNCFRLNIRKLLLLSLLNRSGFCEILSAKSVTLFIYLLSLLPFTKHFWPTRYNSKLPNQILFNAKSFLGTFNLSVEKNNEKVIFFFYVSKGDNLSKYFQYNLRRSSAPFRT